MQCRQGHGQEVVVVVLLTFLSLTHSRQIWNRVYITDLTNLFALLVENILAKKEIPSGKNGYYFAENGFQSWVSIAERIGKAGYEISLLIL
jgi:hypothetical protein